ncbi:aquaporin Z [Microbacterium sp. NPDC019599]|uniref:aquaporin Z n=1 Tax=Microbacterium sp. NPDC019599 TaxID=3154690 RepID=UPI0033E99535
MSDNTSPPSTSNKLVAEALGTFLLVFGGVGTALFAANFPADAADNPLGVGFVGVALAFGLTVVAGAYAWGPISGGHFNPAITLGLAASGRFEWRNATGYIVAQILGGALATTFIVLIGLFGPEGWLQNAQDSGFASNGYGTGSFGSPGGFGLGAAIVAEVLLTAFFVLVILGVTSSSRGTAALAPLAIGLTLTLIHLISIPIDNTSVNPARSIATAIYGGPDALLQLWVFIVFPIVGGLLAGVLHRALFEPKGALPPAKAEARVK